MASNLFRLYRASANVFPCRAAAAPSGGVYAADEVLDGSGAYSSFLRLSASGSITWNKEIDLSGLGVFDVAPRIASNATHVAVAFEYGGDAVVLYDAAGTKIWHTSIPLNHEAGVSSTAPWTSNHIAIAADNSVFVIGSAFVSLVAGEAILCKLDAATGAITWSVNLRPSTYSSTGYFVGAIATLSGGDVIAVVKGTDAYVMRLSGVDGSLVWLRGLTWTAGTMQIGIGVDGSDNVYLVGPGHTSSVRKLPVIKLDSSGTTLWNKQVSTPSGLASLGLQFKWSGTLTCDATGVYIPCAFDDAAELSGHVFVPAAGTTATGNVLVATFASLGGFLSNIGAAGGTDVASVFSYSDKASPGASYYEAIVVTAGSDASEDSTWGGRARTTYAFDLEAGSASIASPSYTRASMPTFTASSFTYVEGAGTLLVENYVPTYGATSLGPTTLFATPRIFGVVSQEPYTTTTGFGTPILSDDVFATSAGPFTAFGTAVYSDDRSAVAAALAAGTTFGLAWAERDPLPGSPTTVAAAPSTVFGTPAVNGAAAVTATGASTTAFGTPVSGWVCPVTGFAVGAFGTPSLSIPVRPTGAAPSTAFGLGMTAGFGSTTGAAPSTAFGLPVATFGAVGVTTGSADTAFGTPSTLNNRQRTRSGVFRTQWGVAQAERTAP